MCGRFVFTAKPSDIQTAFHLSSVPSELPARYNIAPTQQVAVITNDDPTSLDFFRWGLIPSWSKDKSIASKLINARSESVDEKPSFRTAFKKRRCLIPVSGFYEWRTTEGEKNKTPMFIHMQDNQPFAFAGLWEIWNDPEADGKEIRTCSIITTDANPFMSKIHHRMPVILAPEDYATWLEADKPAVLKALLKPFEQEQMAAHPVSTRVNKVSNDEPDLIRPVA